MYFLGYKEVRTQQGTHGLEYVFSSPVREDNKPSLCINFPNNVWSDVPIGEGGNILDLVCYLYGYTKGNIKEALQILSYQFNKTNIDTIQKIRINQKSNFTNLKKERREEAQNKIINIQPIVNKNLINYLQIERKLNIDIALNYVQEIRYETQGKKQYYGIGFLSGNAFVIRSKYYKGFVGVGADITTYNKNTKIILIFEGFIDFLSYLTIKNLYETDYTTIVLNSISFIKRACEEIKRRHSQTTEIRFFCDRDENKKKKYKKDIPSIRALKIFKENMKDTNIKIIDESKKYKNFEDLNDYLITNF
jgi:hypothetical protein